MYVGVCMSIVWLFDYEKTIFLFMYVYSMALPLELDLLIIFFISICCNAIRMLLSFMWLLIDSSVDHGRMTIFLEINSTILCHKTFP